MIAGVILIWILLIILLLCILTILIRLVVKWLRCCSSMSLIILVGMLLRNKDLLISLEWILSNWLVVEFWILVNLHWSICMLIRMVVSCCITCDRYWWNSWHNILLWNFPRMLQILISIMVTFLCISSKLLLLLSLFPSYVLIATYLMLLAWNLVKGFRSKQNIVALHRLILLRVLWKHLSHASKVCIYFPRGLMVAFLLVLMHIAIILLYIGEWIVVVVCWELSPLVNICLVVSVIYIKFWWWLHIWHLHSYCLRLTIRIILRSFSHLFWELSHKWRI